MPNKTIPAKTFLDLHATAMALKEIENGDEHLIIDPRTKVELSMLSSAPLGLRLVAHKEDDLKIIALKLIITEINEPCASCTMHTASDKPVEIETRGSTPDVQKAAEDLMLREVERLQGVLKILKTKGIENWGRGFFGNTQSQKPRERDQIILDLAR
ncbi:hypothetical protein [Thioclava sp. GXIMD4215]|uniref:hypothetical protein n=1 Tax=Thioclava sp. GXIMD4215 TaxID=3131928 RepID=UPI00325605BA